MSDSMWAALRGSRLFLIVSTLTIVGCSQYKPFDSAAFLRQQFAERVSAEDLAGIVVPFQVNDEMRLTLQKLRGPIHGGEDHKVTQLIGFVFDDLGLQYSLAPTRDAAETLRTRRGNCLSFVNLFVGLARDVGLNPFYVEVADYQTWNHRGGMVIS